MGGGIMLPNKERLARVMIYRTGHDVEIMRADGTATENKYGKVSDTDVSYTKVADETARRMYNRRDREPSEGGVDGGRINTDSPRIAMFKDTAAQEDDRLVFETGEEYVLDEAIERDTHTEFRVSLING